MSRRKTYASLLSYWFYYGALIGISFFVSPILVESLGQERYGAWTLLVSFAGYLSVLDLGINAALVRLISKHVALKETDEARAVFSTGTSMLIVMACFALVVILLAGPVFLSRFGLTDVLQQQAWTLYWIVGFDLCLSLAFSSILGCLTGLQQFVRVNLLSTTVAIVKNAVLVLLLHQGHGLLSVALLQLGANATRYLGQYVLLRRTPMGPRFEPSRASRAALRQVWSYGSYGVLIAIALKLMAHADALVIGGFRSTSEVTQYAIPASILEHLERLVLAGVAVAIPLISSREAVGELGRNRNLYTRGTLLTNLCLLPIMFCLFTVGDDFLRLWMGPTIAEQSFGVLQILICGYAFALPQLVSHGILKGTSLHRVLAYALVAQAAVNIGLSVALVDEYGIEGVSVATIIPLVLIHFVVLPIYTCRVLGLPFWKYLRDSYSLPAALLLLLVALAATFPLSLSSYTQLIGYCAAVSGIVFSFAFLLGLDKDLRGRLLRSISWPGQYRD